MRAVALFRGINVGRAKRISMADLRAVVEGLGYGDVRTLLNSGNVVFTATAATAAKAALRIEKGVAADHGIESRVTVLSSAELGAIVKANPLVEMADNPSRLFVTVLADPADRSRLKPLLTQEWAPDTLAVGARAAYLWCPKGIHESKLHASVARLLGDAATTRNWATTLKLHTLLNDTK
ncbi:MAG TPA: DUF1697 domain-containing protein [Candidatus Eisenbacteria bacterium]